MWGLGDNCFPLRKLMEQRTRILLLTPNIGGGGAQHVMVLVARGLSRERFEVHLGLMRAGDAGAARRRLE